jgi:excisionase family DNA binding protein
VSDEIVTLHEAAEYLHCHPSTLYGLLSLRKIPGGFRVGADWRFRRADIDAWIVAEEMKAENAPLTDLQLRVAEASAKRKLAQTKVEALTATALLH